MALSLSLNSCQDEWLTEVNPNNTSTELYFRNNTELQVGLIGVYKAFASPKNHTHIFQRITM